MPRNGKRRGKKGLDKQRGKGAGNISGLNPVNPSVCSRADPRKCQYPLDEVRKLIDSGRARVNEGASRDAMAHYQWSHDEVLAAVRSLKPTEWRKPLPASNITGAVFDVYHKQLRGEPTAYIKFYIDDDHDELLIVVSCKKK